MDFQNATTLQTNVNRLRAGKVKAQFFAIFLDPNTPTDQAWKATLEQLQLFHSEVLQKNNEIIHIKQWKQITELSEREIGAILTLEGAESFGNDWDKLKELYQQGVLSIGLTWNHANLCADGVAEPRGAGLTQLGKEVVQANNDRHVLTDVAHLSLKGFWEVME